jgi:hypothetical protein
VKTVFCVCRSDSILTPAADPIKHPMQQLETGQRRISATSPWTQERDLVRPHRRQARSGQPNTSSLAARARLLLTWKWLIPTTRGRFPTPWDRIGPSQSPKTLACSTTSRLQEALPPRTRLRRSLLVSGRPKRRRAVSFSLRSLNRLLVNNRNGPFQSHSILNISNQVSLSSNVMIRGILGCSCSLTLDPSHKSSLHLK